MGNEIVRRPNPFYGEMDVVKQTGVTNQQTTYTSGPLQQHEQGSNMSSNEQFQGFSYSGGAPPQYSSSPQPPSGPPLVQTPTGPYYQHQMATVSPYCGTGHPQTTVTYTKQDGGQGQTIVLPVAYNTTPQAYWSQQQKSDLPLAIHRRRVIIAVVVSIVLFAIVLTVILYLLHTYGSI
ncbi:hypothetical protein ScPMuIL_009812 [Solemya velum]